MIARELYSTELYFIHKDTIILIYSHSGKILLPPTNNKELVAARALMITSVNFPRSSDNDKKAITHLKSQE